MSTMDASQFLYGLGVQRSHVAVHDRVHRADLQPLSTVGAAQLAVDGEVIRINGEDCWLYGGVDSEANRTLRFRLFPTTTKQTTRRC